MLDGRVVRGAGRYASGSWKVCFEKKSRLFPQRGGPLVQNLVHIGLLVLMFYCDIQDFGLIQCQTVL